MELLSSFYFPDQSVWNYCKKQSMCSTYIFPEKLLQESCIQRYATSVRQQYKYQVMRNCCVHWFSTMDVYATTPWIHETNFTLHEGIYAEKVIYICMSLCLFFHHNVGIRFHPISIKNDYISSIIWNIQSIAWMEGSESWNKLQELSVLNLPIHAEYSKQKRHRLLVVV